MRAPRSRRNAVRLIALLDTNVWVSAFLKPDGPPGRVVSAFLQGHFTVVSSPAQIIEIADVLTRPRLRRRFALLRHDVEAFLGLIAARALLVSTPGALQVCRDPDDNDILEAALHGKAGYLVTRDDDLKRDLELVRVARAQGLHVVSVAQFLKRLSRKQAR